MGAEATVKSKKYAYDYDQYKDGEKGPGTLIEDILADPEFLGLTEIVIGDWGNTWEESCQSILDVIAEQSDRFSHIESLFIGDMGYEECEVSWIMQGDYSRLWEAMPQLKELTIKGSTDPNLGQICHNG